MPKIKCVWSDITYRKNWRVDGWKVWVNGKKKENRQQFGEA